MKRRRCKQCGELFHKQQPMQFVCSPVCAYKYAKTKEGKKTGEKAKRAIRKAEKEKIKTKSQWAKEAQAAFNRYIRERDKDEPCISCGRHHQGQYHAGHYRSVGAHPELRFDDDNCHKQCAPCNNHLSGNIADYRIGLIEKIGIEAVDRLEGQHSPKRYTIEDLKHIKVEYSRKCRELRKSDEI